MSPFSMCSMLIGKSPFDSIKDLMPFNNLCGGCCGGGGMCGGSSCIIIICVIVLSFSMIMK